MSRAGASIAAFAPHSSKTPEACKGLYRCSPGLTQHADSSASRRLNPWRAARAAERRGPSPPGWLKSAEGPFTLRRDQARPPAPASSAMGHTDHARPAMPRACRLRPHSVAGAVPVAPVGPGRSRANPKHASPWTACSHDIGGTRMATSMSQRPRWGDHHCATAAPFRSSRGTSWAGRALRTSSAARFQAP
jgi:hypothetical protein